MIEELFLKQVSSNCVLISTGDCSKYTLVLSHLVYTLVLLHVVDTCRWMMGLFVSCDYSERESIKEARSSFSGLRMEVLKF